MPCDPLGDLRAWQQRLERLSRHQPTRWAPPIDVYETGDAYVVTAEVPGAAAASRSSSRSRTRG